MRKRKKKAPAAIPISEEAGEILSLMQMKGMSMIVQSSILKNQRRGQSIDELMALVAVDFATVRSEADRLQRNLSEQHYLSEWRQYIAENPPSADAIAYLLVLHGNHVRTEVVLQWQELKRAQRDGALVTSCTVNREGIGINGRTSAMRGQAENIQAVIFVRMRNGQH